MIDIITINPIENFTSVKSDNPNFILCHSYTSDLLVTSKIIQILHYTVYYQDGIDDEDFEQLQESYSSDSKMKFRFVPVSYISEALDKIVNKISNRIDPEEDEDIQVMCVMEENIATKCISYLNKSFRNNDKPIDCEATSLLRYSKIPNISSLTKSLKTLFHTEFIYPEDPIQFAHVCRRYIEGRVR